LSSVQFSCTIPPYFHRMIEHCISVNVKVSMQKTKCRKFEPDYAYFIRSMPTYPLYI